MGKPKISVGKGMVVSEEEFLTALENLNVVITELDEAVEFMKVKRFPEDAIESYGQVVENLRLIQTQLCEAAGAVNTKIPDSRVH